MWKPLPAQSSIGLGRKEANIPVLSGHRPHRALEGHDLIGGGQRVGIAEIDLILPRPLFMVEALGHDAHLLEGQADVAADIFSPVGGSHIEITRRIDRQGGGISLLVQLKEVKLALGTDLAKIAHLPRTRAGLLSR